jgi:hypothetical protein
MWYKFEAVSRKHHYLLCSSRQLLNGDKARNMQCSRAKYYGLLAGIRCKKEEEEAIMNEQYLSILALLLEHVCCLNI